MNKIKILTLLLFIRCITSSCYRMPEDGEVSTLPTTNNPSITRQKNANIPGIPNR